MNDVKANAGSDRKRPRSPLSPVTPRDITRYKHVLRRDPCAYCDQPSDVLDHIDPLARGGDDNVDNMTAACNYCNHGKSRRSLLAFMGARRWRAEWDAVDRDRGLWAAVGV